MRFSSKQIIYDYAISLVDRPYIWGGDDFNGLDCSGMAICLLQSAGCFPSHADATAQGLFERFKKRTIPTPCFGTLLFYGSGKDSITHVTFALNDWLMLGAEGGGKTTKTVEDAARCNAFVKIRPISSRRSLVAMAQPNYPWGF